MVEAIWFVKPFLTDELRPEHTWKNVCPKLFSNILNTLVIFLQNYYSQEDEKKILKDKLSLNQPKKAAQN